MGQLINGAWSTEDAPKKTPDGSFRRADTIFRNWVTADGSAGVSGKAGFDAESGRYHLYVSYACPWAHRTLIFRALKDLKDHIGLSVVHPDNLTDGWSFSRAFPGATGDRLYGAEFLRELYVRADKSVTARVTVPVLWDKKRETIVSNESSEIIRMFDSAFDGLTGNSDRYWPQELRPEIEEVNARIYHHLNNGVYKCGFANSQSAYDKAVAKVFETLDWLEERLHSNEFLVANRLTEVDWRLFVTLARFDLVYHTHFKCNRRRIVDYPNLWRYARRLYQWPGVAETVKFDHIARHYYYSLDSINPRRIIPIGPDLDWNAPI